MVLSDRTTPTFKCEFKSKYSSILATWGLVVASPHVAPLETGSPIVGNYAGN